MPNQSERAIEVFFSYSHKDEALRDELAEHLANLRRQEKINDWHDRLKTILQRYSQRETGDGI